MSDCIAKVPSDQSVRCDDVVEKTSNSQSVDSCDSAKVISRSHSADRQNVQGIEDSDDVIRLLSDGQSVFCSKQLLCQHSDYFSAMFSSGMRESIENDVTLHDVDMTVLRVLVQYCHDGKLSLDDTTVWSVLVTSRMLQFTAVSARCEEFLLRHMTVRNVLSVYEQAAGLLVSELHRAAASFLLYHFRRVKTLFHTLSPRDVISLLSSDLLNVISEKEVLETVIQYCESNAVKADMCEELLNCVRFDELKRDALQAQRQCTSKSKTSSATHIDARIYRALEQRNSQVSTRAYPTQAVLLLTSIDDDAKLTLCKFDEEKNALVPVSQAPIPTPCIGYQVRTCTVTVQVVK